MGKYGKIHIDEKPLWQARKGHQPKRTGAGPMPDRRTRRQRTRQTQVKKAMEE